MPGQPLPPTLLEAFAADAAPSYIQFPIPQTTVDPGRASFSLGFPPQTMTPVIAGGTPPWGQDMNGILNTAFQHLCAANAGQLYLYSADLATAMGGYALGATLAMADGTGIWINLQAGNTSDPDANGANWFPMFRYGYTTLAGLTGGTVTPSLLNARAPVIILTGNLVANLQVVLPNTLRQWLIVNSTTGAFATTVKTAAGSGVTIPQGGFSAPVGVYGDGTNLYPTIAPLTIPTAVAPDPNTYVLRDNLGNVYGTRLNQAAGLEVPSVGAVFVQDASADGFLRKISITNFEAQMLLQNIGGVLVNGQVPYSVVAQHAPALFSSPTFTGVPLAPTAAPGTQTTQLATTAFANPAFLALQNGYMRLPNGMMLQWGRFTCNTHGGTGFVAFPVAFSTACFMVLAGGSNATGANAQDNAIDVYTPSGISVNGFNIVNAVDAVPFPGHFFAIGV